MLIGQKKIQEKVEKSLRQNKAWKRDADGNGEQKKRNKDNFFVREEKGEKLKTVQPRQVAKNGLVQKEENELDDQNRDDDDDNDDFFLN